MSGSCGGRGMYITIGAKRKAFYRSIRISSVYSNESNRILILFIHINS